MVLIRRPKSISAGDFSVDECGVALYCKRNVNNCSFGSFFSAIAVWITLHIDFTKFSANPFACGSSGVTGLSVNPICFAYVSRSWLKYGGPLSEVTDSGIPCVEKIRSKIGRSFLNDVLLCFRLWAWTLP